MKRFNIQLISILLISLISASFGCSKQPVEDKAPQDKEIAELIDALADPNKSVPMVKQKLIAKGTDAVPALVDVLRNGDPGSVAKAYFIIGEIGADAVPVIIPLLEDEDSHIRYLAAVILGDIGPPAMDATPHLLKLLGDDNPSVYQAARRSITGIKPDFSTILPQLAGFLKMKKHGARLITLQLLGDYGPEASDALPLLDEMLADKEEEIRVSTRIASARIKHDESSLDTLLECLEHWRVSVQVKAIEGIGDLGSLADDAVPKLMELLDTPDPIYKIEVIAALGEIGPGAAEALPILEEIHRTADPDLSIAASDAIRKIGQS